MDQVDSPKSLSLTPKAQEVLASILSLGTSEDTALQTKRCQSPGAAGLFAFCELLASEPPEEKLQKFLVLHPGFLMGLFGTNDGGDLALIAKPRIGIKYVADFAVLQVFQGGATVFLIEIETSHAKLFTQTLSSARTLQTALTQVDEWREWVSPNKLTFSREILAQATECPMYGAGIESTKGYRFAERVAMEQSWQAFGGFRDPNVHFGVVAGRWGNLSADERVRMMSKFRGDNDLSVFTYDQLARQANYRSDRSEA